MREERKFMDNFIVSARKYRPANFVSVIGQSHITSTLKNAISRNQLAHAYLFCGPRGVGKTTCARIFAKAINCLNPKDAEACNECESCRAFNEGRSFNIHELDAASNNSVDDIRNLTDQVRIPPQIGRYSVYIIDEVHMLSVQAFNAFLKTLEEPPAHAVFILATTEKHKIIPTILSRCQIYDFNRIRVEDVVSYLKYIADREGVAYDDESLHIIALKADGGMRDALSMFDKVVSFCGRELTVGKVAETLNVLDYDTYFTVTGYINEGNYTDTLLLFDDVLRKGFSGQTFVAGLNNHFRDLLMCKNPQTIPLLEVTGSVAEKYKIQAAQCSVQMLFEGISLLTTIDASFRTATNQRLHVELGLMKLCGLGQKKNDEDVKPSLPDLSLSKRHIDTVQPGVTDVNTLKNSGIGKEPGKPLAGVKSSDINLESENIGAGNLTVNEGSSQKSLQHDTTESRNVTSHPAIEHKETVSDGVHKKETDKISIENKTTVVGAVKKTPRPTISFTGRSITSILNSTSDVEQEQEEDESDILDNEPIETDERTEESLEKGCALFAKEMMTARPRIGVAFENVRITGNMVHIKVPNDSLKDEILHSHTEFKKMISEFGGLHVPIEFDITLEVDTKGLKPIKVEDRLNHLTKKNPLLTTLRKQLDLDIE